MIVPGVRKVKPHRSLAQAQGPVLVTVDGGTEGFCRAATRRRSEKSRAKSYKSSGCSFAPCRTSPSCSPFRGKEAMVCKQACARGL